VQRRSPFLLLAFLLVGTGFGIGLGLSEAPTGPIGDAGDILLTELSTAIEGAVPPGTHANRWLEVEPGYTGSCWSTMAYVESLVSFASDMPVSATRSYIAAKLRASGWIRTGPLLGSAGPAIWYEWIGKRKVLANHFIYRWHRRLPQGTNASSTLQVAVPLSGWTPGRPLSWSLGATTSAIGEPKMRCGGGG
jgi:hypothetical protein